MYVYIYMNINYICMCVCNHMWPLFQEKAMCLLQISSQEAVCSHGPGPKILTKLSRDRTPNPDAPGDTLYIYILYLYNCSGFLSCELPVLILNT